jgi:hypothetical protein
MQLASVVESEHFTVEWGPLVNLPEGTAEFMLGALEEVRLKFLDGGYDEPAGNPSQKVPFYFGNSGGSSPAIGFDGGYTTMCAGGEHAYVVMSDIRTDEGSVELATHELFHAVQMGGPASNPVDGWYWEASRPSPRGSSCLSPTSPFSCIGMGCSCTWRSLLSTRRADWTWFGTSGRPTAVAVWLIDSRSTGSASTTVLTSRSSSHTSPRRPR